MADYAGTHGNDNLTGTASNDAFNMVQGGRDRIDGGAGHDSIYMGASLTADDQLNGGKGRDKIYLEGDYLSGLIFSETTATSIEYIALSDGFSYNITLSDAAAGKSGMVIDGLGLSRETQLICDASAELDQTIVFYAGMGNDRLIGGQSGDQFLLYQGGKDIAQGNAGSDSFFLGDVLKRSDKIEGGVDFDTAYIYGDYSRELVFKAATLTGIEHINLNYGYSYNLTVHDETNTSANGGGLTINARLLGPGDFLRLDGSAETASSYRVTGGQGDDELIGGGGDDSLDLTRGGADRAVGGAGSDVFWVTDDFGDDDSIDGGQGSDLVVFVSSQDVELVLDNSLISNVERYDFQGTHFDVELTSTSVAVGETASFGAVNAQSGLTLDGSEESNCTLRVNGSFVNDVIVGGDGLDWLHGGDGDDIIQGRKGADTLVGGGGHDVMAGGIGTDKFVYEKISDTSVDQFDMIDDLGAHDIIDLSSIDANGNDADGDSAFILVNELSGEAGQMMLLYNTDNDYTSLLLDIDGDSMADGMIRLTGYRLDYDNFYL